VPFIILLAQFLVRNKYGTSLAVKKRLNFDKAKSYAKSGAYFVYVAEAVRTQVSYSLSMQ